MTTEAPRFDIQDNSYRIKEARRNRYLTFDDDAHDNVVTMEDAKVYWTVQMRSNSGDATITEKNSENVLDCEGGAGPNVILYSINGNGTDNQRWVITETGDDDHSQYIESVQNNNHVLVADPGHSRKCNVHIARKGSSVNEKWVFVKQ